MAEEPEATPAGATATEEPPAEAAEATEPPAPEGPKPIELPREALTAEAKKEIEEDSGKPVVDLAYEIKDEEQLPGVMLSLKFEIASDLFARELDGHYQNLRKEVVLPGYRKGKAPIKLIRIRMGSDADKDAMVDIAANVMRQEAIKRELKLVANAQIVKWETEEGRPLTFEIRSELEPTVELKEYKGLSVEVEVQDVTDQQVDEEIERLRRQTARQESAPKDAKVGPDDAIVVDLKVRGADGQELKHLNQPESYLQNFKTQLPAALAEKIEGLKVGESAEAEVEGTRNSRRGEEVKFTDTYSATIKDIKTTVLPDLDDEFAKDLGEHDTLVQLRQATRKSLDEKEQERRKQASIMKLHEAIIEKNPFDVPASMIAHIQYHQVMQDSQQLSQFGLNLSDVVQDATAYMSSQRNMADFTVKRSLILAELAKAESLEVSEADQEKEIAALAEREGRKPLAIRARLEAEGQLENFRENLLRRKVEESLLELNTVEFIPAKTEEESKAEAGEEEAETKKTETKAEAEPAKKKATKKSPDKKSK